MTYDRENFLKMAREKFPDERDFARVQDALEYATGKHAGVVRLSGEPYIIHPIYVATLLLEWGMDRDTVIAGLLHDVVEDTDTTAEEVGAKFGDDVALLVDGVTKVGQARAGREDVSKYLPETKDTLMKLLVATGSDVRVLIVKLADRIHNLRTLEFQSAEKQKKKSRESLEVFGPLADRLNMGRVKTEIEDTSFHYLEPVRYEYLKHELETRVGNSRKELDKVENKIREKLEEEKIDGEISGRMKSVYSLHKKLGKKDSIDDIHDLIALRVIVDDMASCYLVLGVIHELYEPLPGRIKDYISRPKSNGYQSLHTTVITPDGQIVEFQIRTHQMHDFAEYGLAAHFHYDANKSSERYKKGAVEALPENLRWVLDLQDAATKLRSGEEVDFDALKLNLFSDRIFVYTPRGDIFDMPSGALPLDFAYRVHSELGKTATAFRINGKIAKFDKPLKSGDIVEIISRKNQAPKADWLAKVGTNHARAKIRSQLRAAGIATAKRNNPQKKSRSNRNSEK